MRGKKRCAAHGGKTPVRQNGGATNSNHRHGLYSAALSPAEAAMWDDISLDSLTGFNLVEIRRSSDQNGSGINAISRRPDLSARQDRLLGRVAQLIKTRAELEAMKSQQGDPTIRFVIEAPREETVDEWQANYGPASPQEGA